MEISNLTVSVLYRGKWDLGLIQNLDSDKLLGHEGMLCGFPLSLGLLRFEVQLQSLSGQVMCMA
jgi:hypothetical protein